MTDRSPVPEDEGLTFDPKIHWCERHMGPFKDEWPRGWGLAMMGLFEECLRRQEIIDAASADTRMLDRVLREFSPLCCYLGDEVTAHWTEASFAGPEAFREALAEVRKREPS